MIPTNTSPRRSTFAIAILISLALGLLALWFRGGLGATEYSTSDTQGRTMGFNDVLSAEHYQIIWSKASWAAAAEQMSIWAGALIVVQIGFLIAVLAGQAASRARAFKWLLWLQPLAFFCGLLGLYILPLWLVDLMGPKFGSDRESYVDLPFVEIIGQGAWLWACIFMLWKLRKPVRP